MLMFLSGAQIDDLVVSVLDMQADNAFIELAAELQIGHVQHGVAGADDVERRLEDMLRYGHCVSPLGPCHSGARSASPESILPLTLLRDGFRVRLFEPPRNGS